MFFYTSTMWVNVIKVVYLKSNNRLDDINVRNMKKIYTFKISIKLINECINGVCHPSSLEIKIFPELLNNYLLMFA